MKQERTKLCPSCEGSVLFSIEHCPYCGHNFASVEPSGFTHAEYKQQDLLHNFNPPYMDRTIPRVEEERPKEEEAKKRKERIKQKSILLTIFLLTFGSYLFTLGLLVFFFSENGKLILEWKSRYSLLYCLAAAPILYISFIRLKNE